MYNAGYITDTDSENETKAVGQGIFYLPHSIPVFAQSEIYYCGPASTIMAQIGNGKLSNTPASFSNTKQQEMAESLDTTYASGTYVSKMSAYLYAHASNGYDYDYYDDLYDDANDELYLAGLDFVDDLRTSLSNNFTPVVQISDCSFLPYYGSNYKGSPHYMVVTQINDINGTITVLDPHYDDTYNGYHTMSTEQFVCACDYGWLIAYGI